VQSYPNTVLCLYFFHSAASRFDLITFIRKVIKQQNNPENPACPAVPRSIPKDSAAYLTGVAPADGTGVKPGLIKDKLIN